MDPLSKTLKKTKMNTQRVGGNGICNAVIAVCPNLHERWEGWGLLCYCQSVFKLKMNVVFCDLSLSAYTLLSELLSQRLFS